MFPVKTYVCVTAICDLFKEEAKDGDDRTIRPSTD